MKHFLISIVLTGLIATSFADDHNVTIPIHPSNETTTSHHTTTTTKVMTTTKEMTTTQTLSTTTETMGTPIYAATNDAGNVTCLLIQSDISTTFTYNDSKTNSTVPRDPNIISKCGDSADEIALNWGLKSGVEKTLLLRYTKGDNDYSLTYVEFSFTDLKSAHVGFANASFDSQLQTNVGSSYRCESGVTITVGDMTLVMNNLTSNAFMEDTSKTPSFQATGSDCSYNGKTDAIVPIAVGAALAAMVIIVLIGYCIGRRRTSSGYQSMTEA